MRSNLSDSDFYSSSMREHVCRELPAGLGRRRVIASLTLNELGLEVAAEGGRLMTND
ncbi:hypothetical protein AB0M20_30745 [Actinoplanes sp. NPDC051633]|uniref:hypothetical protein n=1 Tax=Actinoplanes sp. NPDC051633 TaxID=3155670 RepID=UPI00343C8718